MYGDIFGSGQNFALTQYDGGVGFSEWKDGNWKPEETLSITSEWAPKGGENPYLGRTTPAERAFWTLDIGRGCRVAVIACDTEKYFQTFCVLQFNGSKKELEIVGPSMEPPRIQLGYLLTFNCSSPRSEWQAWDYFHTSKGLLIHSAQWSEWRNNSNPDDGLTTLRTYNREGQLAETFDVEDGWMDQNNYNCTLSRSVANYSAESLPANQKAPGLSDYAQIKINWPNGEGSDPDGLGSVEAYLFEKLTGIPHDLFQNPLPPNETETPWPKVEKLATIKITGSADAVARLSIKRPKN
jgi:hypothetical protein